MLHFGRFHCNWLFVVLKKEQVLTGIIWSEIGKFGAGVMVDGGWLDVTEATLEFTGTGTAARRQERERRIEREEAYQCHK